MLVNSPSSDTVLICQNLKEVTITEAPEFQFKCPKCDKGVTHKGNLKKYINDNNEISNLEVSDEDKNMFNTAAKKTPG